MREEGLGITFWLELPYMISSVRYTVCIDCYRTLDGTRFDFIENWSEIKLDAHKHTLRHRELTKLNYSLLFRCVIPKTNIIFHYYAMDIIDVV